MATYIVLGNYTDQGMRKLKQLAQLRQAGEQWAAAHGGRILSNYTTLGAYDFVLTIELPSDDLALEGAFTFGSLGDLRSQTLRAFPAQEAEAIAQRIP